MLPGKHIKNRIKISIKILQGLPDKKKYLTLPLIFMALSSAVSLTIPLMAMSMLNYFKERQGMIWENIILTGLCWLAALVLVAFLEYIQKLRFRNYAQYILNDTHNTILSKNYNAYFSKLWLINSKEISDEVIRDLDELYPFYAGSIFDLCRNYLVILAACLILVLLNLKLTIALMILLPFYLIIHLFWYSKLKKAYFICREASQKYLGTLVEFFQTFSVIGTYNSFCYEQLRVSRDYNELLGKRYFYFAQASKKIIFSKTLSSVAPIYLLFCFFLFIHLGWTSVTEIVGFWGVFSLLLSSVNSVTNQSLSILNSMEVYNKIYMSKVDKIDKEPCVDGNIKNISCMETQEIKLSFNGGSKNIVYPNFRICNGEWTEIRGRSGVGKTSLIKCLLGQIIPADGSVKINGFNLNNVNINNYLSHIGYVEQNGYIYSRTIKENILLNREYDPDLFNNAIRTAHLDNLIFTKQDKENSLIGENGMQLSGGEKQRIVIARALYHQPEWLIFDEPFSGLDKDNIDEMLSIIKSLRNNYTAVIVSHRELDNINFDKIIQLN